MAVDKELLKGTTAVLVLQLLSRRRMYGYEIIQQLELLSNGLFEFKEGTLYPLLHGLESAGAVNSEWSGAEGSRQRKYYVITREGRALLKRKKQAWDEFREAVENIFSGMEA